MEPIEPPPTGARQSQRAEDGVVYPTSAGPYATPIWRRPWSWGEMAAWALILVLAAFIATLAAFAQMRQNTDALTDDTLRLTSRYAMGVHLLSAAMGQPPPAFGGALHMDAELLRQLDGQARTPEDRFRVAIVAGELVGRDEALTRMNALADQEGALQADLQTADALYEGRQVAEETWVAFRAKYDWFAELLASAGKPAGNPQRDRAVSPVYRTLFALLGFFVVAGLLALAGLVLLIVGIVLLACRRMKIAFSPADSPGVVPRADRRSYLYGFACYMMLMIAIALVLRLVLAYVIKVDAGMVLSLLVTLAAFAAGLLVPLVFGQSWSQWRLALGLHAGRGIWREIGSGLLGYLAGVPLLIVGIILVAFLSQLSGMKGSHPITEELRGSYGELALVFILACVLAPITEELMFRGALFAHLRERFGWWISAPAVAVIFAIIHPQGWVALPALASLALVFAAIREWRGSIIGCMAAHALHNGLTLAFAVMLLR
jgi:membrane protease YdiL (CAAX protease family)